MSDLIERLDRRINVMLLTHGGYDGELLTLLQNTRGRLRELESDLIAEKIFNNGSHKLIADRDERIKELESGVRVNWDEWITANQWMASYDASDDDLAPDIRKVRVVDVSMLRAALSRQLGNG